MPTFVVLCFLMCALWWLGKQRLMRLLVPLLVLSTLSIVVYTGAEIMVVRSRPLWNTLWVPINLALSGCALMRWRSSSTPSTANGATSKAACAITPCCWPKNCLKKAPSRRPR